MLPPRRILLLLVLPLLLLAAPRLPAQSAAPYPAPSSVHVNWWQKLQQGGVGAAIQIAVSILGGAYAIGAYRQSQRKHIVPDGVAAEAILLWRNRNFLKLEKFGATHPSTLGRAIAFIARHRASSVADISATVSDILSREMDQRLQLSYPLGVIATLQPLLGLLGMIFGMIASFEKVATAGALGNAALLASGIAEALVTTGLGIALAIPFLALYHYFKHRNTHYTLLLEEQVSNFLTESLMPPPPALETEKGPALLPAKSIGLKKPPAPSQPADISLDDLLAQTEREEKQSGRTDF